MKIPLSTFLMVWASMINLSFANAPKEENEGRLPAIVRHVMTGDAAEVISYQESGGNLSLKVDAGDDKIPLLFFARDLTMTRLMVHLGADIKEKTKYNHTALMNAVRMGDFDLSRYLVREGLSIDEIDDHGNHLIHFAVGNRNSRILDWLLEEGANPNAKDNEGETPLMESLRNCDLDEIKSLLKHGANIHLKDNEGNSIIDYLDKGKEFEDQHQYLAAKDLIHNEIIRQSLEKSEPVDGDQ